MIFRLVESIEYSTRVCVWGDTVMIRECIVVSEEMSRIGAGIRRGQPAVLKIKKTGRPSVRLVPRLKGSKTD